MGVRPFPLSVTPHDICDTCAMGVPLVMPGSGSTVIFSLIIRVYIFWPGGKDSRGIIEQVGSMLSTWLLLREKEQLITIMCFKVRPLGNASFVFKIASFDLSALEKSVSENMIPAGTMLLMSEKDKCHSATKSLKGPTS